MDINWMDVHEYKPTTFPGTCRKEAVEPRQQQRFMFCTYGRLALLSCVESGVVFRCCLLLTLSARCLAENHVWRSTRKLSKFCRENR